MSASYVAWQPCQMRTNFARASVTSGAFAKMQIQCAHFSKSNPKGKRWSRMSSVTFQKRAPLHIQFFRAFQQIYSVGCFYSSLHVSYSANWGVLQPCLSSVSRWHSPTAITTFQEVSLVHCQCKLRTNNVKPIINLYFTCNWEENSEIKPVSRIALAVISAIAIVTRYVRKVELLLSRLYFTWTPSIHISKWKQDLAEVFSLYFSGKL